MTIFFLITLVFNLCIKASSAEEMLKEVLAVREGLISASKYPANIEEIETDGFIYLEGRLALVYNVSAGQIRLSAPGVYINITSKHLMILESQSILHGCSLKGLVTFISDFLLIEKSVVDTVYCSNHPENPQIVFVHDSVVKKIKFTNEKGIVFLSGYGSVIVKGGKIIKIEGLSLVPVPTWEEAAVVKKIAEARERKRKGSPDLPEQVDNDMVGQRSIAPRLT